MKTRLLVADDNPDHQSLLRLVLESSAQGLDIRIAASAAEFLDRVRKEHFDCVVLDYHLGDCHADELLRRAGADLAGTPVVIVSSSQEQAVVIASLRRGVADFVPKEQATTGPSLWNAIQSALAIERAEQKDRRQVRRRELSLARLAETDPLTGLMNRRGLDRVLSSSRGRKDQRARTACIMLDIDHFKAINDTHGHSAGDRILTDVAALLRHASIPSDHLVRWGGEEFVLIRTSADVADAWSLAERFRRTVEGTDFDLGHTRIRITLSAGVAVVPTQELGESGINLADHAMYLAKDGGRNRVATSEMVHYRRLAETIGASAAEAGSTPEARRLCFLRAAAPTLAPGQFEHLTSHCEAVSIVAYEMAQRLGLSPVMAERVRLAGLFHDIGKCIVPDRLISKPGPLAADEAWLMDLHTGEGAELTDALGLHPDVVCGVRHHHRWHSRVPRASHPASPGSSIAELVSAADAIVAMTSHRPYRPAISIAEAGSHMLECTERQFARAAVGAAIEAISGRPVHRAAA